MTRAYSTSFSIAVSNLNSEMKAAIYSIYGFVRFADEIVDSFHDHDKKELLEKFEKDYYDALNRGISLNPVLNSFQLTVKKYSISDDLIQAFLNSMKSDIDKTGKYDQSEFEKYIYGSAEAVGLMCLKVFTGGDEKKYTELKLPAMKLGSAFQKVNFLRDLKNDAATLGREYFPGTNFRTFGETEKTRIITDIENDFKYSLTGIRKLSRETKLPVFIAFLYFRELLKKISATKAEKLISGRIRINNLVKGFLLVKGWFLCKFNLV